MHTINIGITVIIINTHKILSQKTEPRINLTSSSAVADKPARCAASRQRAKY